MRKTAIFAATALSAVFLGLTGVANATATPPATAPVAASASDGVDVRIVERGNGITKITSLEPSAQGAAALAASLRAGDDSAWRGIEASTRVAVREGSATVVVVDDTATLNATVTAAVVPPTACNWGTARTLACPPPRWSNNGYSNPRISYYDRSGIPWPQGSAVTKWNTSTYIDLYYTTSGCPTTTGYHCVPVSSGNFGPNGWIGLTSSVWYDATLYFVDGQNTIKYNDYYSVPGDPNLSTACHESGHALGLDHNTSSGSCLYSTRVANRSTTPNADDFGIIANIIYK